MKNYKLTISFDGTRYYGWEHQPDQDTVQGRIENVLSRLCEGAPVEVIGAGRTDAGVHARGMVASVKMECSLSGEELRDYMNRYLPDDICVTEAGIASERFHARYNAVGKEYCYTFYIGELKPVFNRKYVTVLEKMPDVRKMREAAEILQGTHDFKAFCTNPNMKKSTVRTVDEIRIVEKKEYLCLYFHGDGFLQNMVRILSGTLLDVGKGKYAPEHCREIMKSLDRTQAGPTLPPQGLCLMRVDY